MTIAIREFGIADASQLRDLLDVVQPGKPLGDVNYWWELA